MSIEIFFAATFTFYIPAYKIFAVDICTSFIFFPSPSLGMVNKNLAIVINLSSIVNIFF